MKINNKTMKTLKLLGALAVVVVMFLGGVYYNTAKPDTILGGNYRENTKEIAIITNATTTATGNTASVVYYRNVGITVATESASGTLKFACSLQDAVPNFATTTSATNAWDYVDFTNFQNNTSVDGDTGIVLANTTGVEQLYVTGNNFRWCTALLSGTVSGTTTVRIKPADNS